MDSPREIAPAPAVNDCDATSQNQGTEPTKLCLFMPSMTVAEQISRVLRYVQDPVGYLKSSIGEAAFDRRKELLCVPYEIDRDVYGRSDSKHRFEEHVARNVLGKQHCLFFITGVQAQLAAIRIHCDHVGRPHAAWHVSSHLESAEERAFEALYGLKRTLLGKSATELPTAGEIKTVLSLPLAERPAVLLIELPNRELGCKTYTYLELEQIYQACKEAQVRLHLDGARLGEIEPYYMATAAKTFQDIAALFDSVYVSFHKGLGGVSGAMLVHNEETFIDEARMWQRRTGGNAFTLYYEAIDCERGFNESIGTFARKREKMMDVAARISIMTEGSKTSDGKRIVSFAPEVPTCCQANTVFEGFTVAELEGARDAVQQKTNVRVFERLRPKETLDEKLAAARKPNREQNCERRPQSEEDDRCHTIEWMMIGVTELIQTDVFVKAYVDLCEELVALSRHS
ncbi:hypothetical protein B0A50_06758 [Salinomyces thailandicus]|uniref:Aromatic amino acid beta-eliminating lyase/threonine aldolase domain-containing protein n=1 Tax=Salinomyces thailandicus TaxID=706561 RepID=A0A4U0TQQ4_9PEZI|nr:hypothetical protein B0A50_06758 [Salinomyces thailandica]